MKTMILIRIMFDKNGVSNLGYGGSIPPTLFC
jgi:hypothetical protein